jgi:hypothetical protein
VDLVGKHGRVRTIPVPTWVRIPSDADQRSEVMAIAIPN